MDDMDLVENTSNAKPFQCDWQTSGKVTSSVTIFEWDSQLILYHGALSVTLAFKYTTGFTPMRGLTLL